jgi:hypothetical protein
MLKPKKRKKKKKKKKKEVLAMAEEKKKNSPANERTSVESFDDAEDVIEEAGNELFDEETESASEEATTPDIQNENLEQAEASMPTLTLSPDDLPDAEGLDVGNAINATVELTLKNKNEDGTLEFDVTDVISKNEEADLEAQAQGEGPGGLPGGAPPIPGGGGLAGAF